MEGLFYFRVALAVLYRAALDKRAGNQHADEAHGFLESPFAAHAREVLSATPAGIRAHAYLVSLHRMPVKD